MILKFIPIRVMLLFLITYTPAFAQVGIGTVTPDGVLDLNNDSGTNNYGLVLPRVALTRTDVAAPIIDPDPGATAGTLPVGTVVYNTATTNAGAFSVYPGIYMWDGIDWVNEFPKRDVAIYKQFEGVDGGPGQEWLRTITTGLYQDIPNMVGRTFTPTYSGTYKVEVSVNFGSGQASDAGSSTDVAVQKGNFRFTFDGVDEFIPVQSWSTHNGGSGTRYFDIWEQTTVVYYQELVAGTTYTFSIGFDQTDSTGFINNGDCVGGCQDNDVADDGAGWIGRDLPCSVEFIYLD